MSKDVRLKAWELLYSFMFLMLIWFKYVPYYKSEILQLSMSLIGCTAKWDITTEHESDWLYSML